MSIVIPVYNNKTGLISTLLSISEMKKLVTDWVFKVIIVDDCSDDDYEDIPSLFANFLDIEILSTTSNSGPAEARQVGLDKSCFEYIMFMDAGDVLGFPSHFIQLMDIIKHNPQIKMFSCSREYISGTKINDCVGPHHNMMHGKVYRLDFLRNYNISFIKGRYYAEDLGFNTACRLICERIEQETRETQLLEFPKPITTEIFNPNSITRKNNGEFRFYENNGLGPNMIHAFNIALENKVSKKAIKLKAYESFVWQYIYFYDSYFHKKFINESLEGCIYYYKHFKEMFSEIDEKFLVKAYNTAMKELYTFIKDSAFDISIPKFSIWDYIDLLEEKLKEQE